MITAKLQGGLGNMMFQMAAAISLAIDLKTDFAFDIAGHKCLNQGNDAITYKNNIFSKIPKLNCSNWMKPLYQEPFFHYKPLPTEHKDLMIEGYFQSEKYFAHNAEAIREIFNYNPFKDDNYPQNIYCFHSRKGDFVKFPNHHPIITREYYEKAHKYLKENYKVDGLTIFTDSTKVSDVNDFCLMQTFQYYIISNSSFSWWASWLNPNPEKVIIAPRQWFGPAINHDTKDLYTPNMIIL